MGHKRYLYYGALLCLSFSSTFADSSMTLPIATSVEVSSESVTMMDQLKAYREEKINQSADGAANIIPAAPVLVPSETSVVLRSLDVPDISILEQSNRKMFLLFLIIVVILLGILYYLKRYKTGFYPSGSMQVIDSISLGMKEKILIVEVDHTWLVIGVTAHKITPLYTTLKPSALQEKGGNQPAPDVLFQSMMKKYSSVADQSVSDAAEQREQTSMPISDQKR